MIDKSYGTYIRKDVLKPLIEAEDGPIPEGKVAVERSYVQRENRTLDRPLRPSRRESGKGSTGYKVEAGKLKIP